MILFDLYDRASAQLARQDWLLPTLARLVFAGVLAVYYLNSGFTKLDGFGASSGAYVQILPRAFEAAGYDASALAVWQHLIVYAGIVAEFVLPVLIILGLLTRLAALGMIGFIVMQSLTDLYGHGQWDALGGWFDRFADALILDQRAFWVFALLTLVIKGAGPLSLDRLFRKGLS